MSKQSNFGELDSTNCIDFLQIFLKNCIVFLLKLEYLFIFAKFKLAFLGETAKINYAKTSSAKISFLKNLSP